MTQTTPWDISPVSGFLIQPQPLADMREIENPLPPEIATTLESCAAELPELIASGQLVAVVSRLPLLEVEALLHNICDERLLERLFALYGYIASALVHGAGQAAIPAAVAVPLVQISAALQRPPMLSYTAQVLHNWRLRDPHAGFIPQNIDLLLAFTTLADEHWFFKVHIAIEAQAGDLLDAMRSTFAPVASGDDFAVQDCLRRIHSGLVRITRTFHQMPEGCDPDIYYQQIRIFLMSFGADVRYEGVTPNPAPLRGGSGAQSSIVPAVLAYLGIHHESTELTSSLLDMRPYMPQAHRAFIAGMETSRLREYCAARPALRDAYNHVLHQLVTFRRAHLYYARTYIFSKSTNPTGTGGTSYLSFLSKLIDETSEQFLLK